MHGHFLIHRGTKRSKTQQPTAEIRTQGQKRRKCEKHMRRTEQKSSYLLVYLQAEEDEASKAQPRVKCI